MQTTLSQIEAIKKETVSIVFPETSRKPEIVSKLETSGGSKFDSGKPMMDLLDPAFLIGVSQVLTFGAKKYAAHNWRGGIKASRIIAACLRHLVAIMRGEDIDDETGLHHGYHLGCEVMFLTSMLTTRKDMDDRYRPTERGREAASVEGSGRAGSLSGQGAEAKAVQARKD